MTSERPAASDRSTALRRGILFIVATSPIWLVPKRFPVFHPVAMLGVMLGATLLFLWWDKRSPSELGIDLSWRPPANLLAGLVGGTLLILVIAVLLHAVLPFEWV
ncbi:MAG: hypothetical protein JF589_13400, partial [Gemmatimonadetes bacterium]|nr:hypothetical protein [Gemmatimonadota bacterium]